MSQVGHNNPPVTLELAREEAEFALKNVETNITQGLALLQSGLSPGSAEKIVTLIEDFKPIRDKLKAALK